eukprot:g19269.t1
MPDPPAALIAVLPLMKSGGRVFITQTFQKKHSPLMAFIKPLMKYITTIDFGQLTTEEDLERIIARADCFETIENEPISNSINNHVQTARLLCILQENIGALGWLAFSWFTPIVDLAFRRDQENGKLEPTDVYPLTRKNVAARQLERLDQHWQVELQKEKPALIKAMKRAFWKEVFGTAWVKFINDCLHFVGPFLLNRTTGMRLRTGLILMSYSKALRVLPWATPPPKEEPQEQQPRRCCKKTPKKKPQLPTGGMGQMTNIISADTDKFTFLMPYFNLIWSCPLQIVICFVMLAHYVQWALFAGVGVMILFTILSSTVANKARKIQAEAMKAKDERLKMEVELLKIVKIIKFYAWELAIENRVKELRNKESGKLWNVLLFLSFSLSPVLVALGTFACYTILQKKNLDAATAFTACHAHARPSGR